tara:strand:+ start:887 stop:1468 length:582 start_codon:yes stop_codon:yes gene_type:complete
MSEESEETGTPVGLEHIINKFQEHVVKTVNEAAAKGEGMKSLTDKEIADYLRNEAPYIVEKIYRALKKDAGPINTSDITPPPLPMKFMTRALTLGVSVIVLNWSGGSDEGHLYADLRNEDGKPIYGSTDEGIANLRSEIEEWGYDTMSYGGAGDGSSYGDIIRYNLKEGTVSTEAWWTEEIHGGEKSDTMETC